MRKPLGNCFTIHYEKLEDTLSNSVSLQPCGADANPVTITAVWDTGATCSVITEDIATKFNLAPVSFNRITTPTVKDHEVPEYVVDVHLPNTPEKVTVQYLKVCACPLSGFDMLIGMDVIQLGDFAVTNHLGKTTFSFRMPSHSKIDFEKNSHLTVKGTIKRIFSYFKQ